jgi:hypothetical protein
MVSIKNFRQLALAFDEVTEQPHFEKISFSINKKIFATLDAGAKKVVVKLSAIDQSVFCSFNQLIIYPVSGTWGRQGWTAVELSKIKPGMLKDIIKTAYWNVAPKRLSEKHRRIE